MSFPEGQIRVFVYGQPVSMRLSYDGLYALARHGMGQDPLSGNLFAFINRRATQIKVLYFDRTGWCIWSKRLEQGAADRQLGRSSDTRNGLDRLAEIDCPSVRSVIFLLSSCLMLLKPSSEYIVRMDAIGNVRKVAL